MALITGTLVGFNTYSFWDLLVGVFGVDVPEREWEEKEIMVTAEEILPVEGVITKEATDAKEPLSETSSQPDPSPSIKQKVH